MAALSLIRAGAQLTVKLRLVTRKVKSAGMSETPGGKYRVRPGEPEDMRTSDLGDEEDLERLERLVLPSLALHHPRVSREKRAVRREPTCSPGRGPGWRHSGPCGSAGEEAASPGTFSTGPSPGTSGGGELALVSLGPTFSLSVSSQESHVISS